MTATIELNSARNKLSAVLGESEIDYFTHLKNWFRKRISKENFDTEARKLLAREHAHLHNEFLLAILNKCQTLASFTTTPTTVVAATSAVSSPVVIKSEFVAKAESGGVVTPGQDRIKRGKIKTKRKSCRANFDQRFYQQHLISDVGEVNNAAAVVHPREEERALKYCYREPTLPDVSFIHGRMLVAAWEDRLEGVEDPAVVVMVKAVENQLRKLVMALVMARRGYRMREGRFPHQVGAEVPNSWLKNAQRYHAGAAEVSDVSDELQEGDPLVPASRPTVEDAEQRAVFEAACSGASEERQRRPISLFDLMRLLQERKSLIPCHSVYSKNLERIIARLHHSGHDD